MAKLKIYRKTISQRHSNHCGSEGPTTSKDLVLNGHQNNDELLGMDGDDTLKGEGGSDTLKGNEGNDSIAGGDDDDVLEGEAEMLMEMEAATISSEAPGMFIMLTQKTIE